MDFVQKLFYIKGRWSRQKKKSKFGKEISVNIFFLNMHKRFN